MVFFTRPRSFALNSFQQQDVYDAATLDSSYMINSNIQYTMSATVPHSSHPDFGHLVLLVFEAVLEVVFVSLPGYIVARQGMFDAEAQKFVANLNVMVFTPCLIFTKLASQLTADKLVDLAIIPAIFVIQTFVSYLSSLLISKCFRFKKRPRNFVIAMGVFGNSNSLPISLVLSLSKTISGLHWDQVPGDNDNEVAARGILYLLIFQQLGQLLRWTWGYNVLLKPKEAYEEEVARQDALLEEARQDDDESGDTASSQDTLVRSHAISGEATPLLYDQSPGPSKKSSFENPAKRSDEQLMPPVNGNLEPDYDILRDGMGDEELLEAEERTSGIRNFPTHVRRFAARVGAWFAAIGKASFSKLPSPLQKVMAWVSSAVGRFAHGVWEFMNPPLWAMLVAIIIASIPDLQAAFFTKGTFVNNSITRAISQSGSVAVPLILVVLGANLARNTLPREALETPTDPDEPSDKKLLFAALISRMLLPTIIMAPIIALVAKYVPVSILDDPIFVIVVFLLTGAPSALQLAQICQLNNVYMGAMSKLLFQSYVVWILPSTLILVMLALEVVEWAM